MNTKRDRDHAALKPASEKQYFILIRSRWQREQIHVKQRESRNAKRFHTQFSVESKFNRLFADLSGSMQLQSDIQADLAMGAHSERRMHFWRLTLKMGSGGHNGSCMGHGNGGATGGDVAILSEFYSHSFDNLRSETTDLDELQHVGARAPTIINQGT
jgi:hypothetical protein